MEIDVVRREAYTFVRVGENVTFECASRFKAAFDRVLKDPTPLVLDLSNVSYLCSTGLGVMISVFKDLQGKGHGVSLVAVQPKVLQVLELTHMQRLAQVVANLEDALVFLGLEAAPSSEDS